MDPSISSRWTTDPEYFELLNFIIEKTKNVESPMNILRMAREFNEKSGAPQSESCIAHRIEKLTTMILSFEHIDTKTKVKVLFALSASVDTDFLREWRKNAFVRIDEKKRIIQYEANDGSLTLRGDHSPSAKTKSAVLFQKNYFANKKIYLNAVSKDERVKEKCENVNSPLIIYQVTREVDPEYIDLLNFLIEKTENVKSPMNMQRMAIEYKERRGAAQTVNCLVHRIKRLRTMIHNFDIDKNTIVKMLFALSASVDKDFLEKLKTDSIVIIDDKKQITHYKANDGSLELKGDHSVSAKNRAAQLESNHLKLIRDYFKNKNDSYAVPNNEKAKKMGSLIEFITEKCDNIDSPLSITKLAEGFNNHFEIPIALETIRGRIRAYCCEIQKLEVFDTHTKVKQLFGLSGAVDSIFLNELRKDADVEVDDLNRITKYTAHDGRLTLHGDHCQSAREKKKNTINKHSYSDGDEEEESEHDGDQLEDDIAEYASEEFDGEFDSEDENDPLDETEDLMEQSNEAVEFDNFEFDPPTRRSYWSEEIEMRKYYTNCSIDDQIKLEPFRGSIQEDFKDIKEDEDIQQIPRPSQILDEDNQLMGIKEENEEPVANFTEPLEVKPEVPVKIEHDEPVEVKPETSHNSKLKFFEAMKSLILCLDTPSLSRIQSKIHQKIQKIRGPDEVILNCEIALMIDSLISRVTFYSEMNNSKNAESVNLSNVLCYLKAVILNSKMSGVGDSVKYITKLIEESQNKRVPVGAVSHALQATLEFDSC